MMSEHLVGRWVGTSYMVPYTRALLSGALVGDSKLKRCFLLIINFRYKENYKMSLIYNLDRVNSVNQPNSKTRERTQNNKTIILATSQEIHVVIPGTKSVISMALIGIL